MKTFYFVRRLLRICVRIWINRECIHAIVCCCVVDKIFSIQWQHSSALFSHCDAVLMLLWEYTAEERTKMQYFSCNSGFFSNTHTSLSWSWWQSFYCGFNGKVSVEGAVTVVWLDLRMIIKICVYYCWWWWRRRKTTNWNIIVIILGLLTITQMMRAWVLFYEYFIYKEWWWSRQKIENFLFRTPPPPPNAPR